MIKGKYDMYHISTIETMREDLKIQYDNIIKFYYKNKPTDNKEYKDILEKCQMYISELQEFYFYYNGNYKTYDEKILEISGEIKKIYDFTNNFSF